MFDLNCLNDSLTYVNMVTSFNAPIAMSISQDCIIIVFSK